MLRNALHAVWLEPRVPTAPRRVWRDWALLALLLATTLTEALLRTDLVWKGPSVAVGAGLVFTVLIRRTRPLVAVIITFGAFAAMDLAALVVDAGPPGTYTNLYALIVVYALYRWGSGREIVLGLPFLVAAYTAAIGGNWTGVSDAIIAAVFLFVPAILGVLVRTTAATRDRNLEQVRLREREQLARDLHDSVAHHVSAILIRAQAGRYVAATDPEAAVEALRVIEDEATRSLAEMRLIVGVLRDGEEAKLAPTPAVADIARLAAGVVGSARVDVALAGDLDNLPPAVAAAIYRIAQESITNATRHARDATRIEVRVTGDRDAVRLTVQDDGAVVVANGVGGYGLAGMAERATLLGGTLVAGPAPGRGWSVDAVVPRAGTAA